MVTETTMMVVEQVCNSCKILSGIAGFPLDELEWVSGHITNKENRKRLQYFTPFNDHLYYLWEVLPCMLYNGHSCFKSSGYKSRAIMDKAL